MDRTLSLKLLGKRIKSIRTSKNFTQVQLADVCGLNRNYIGMLERGERNPTYITLIRIAQLLKIPLSELIGD